MPIRLMVWSGPGSGSVVIKVASAYESARTTGLSHPSLGLWRLQSRTSAVVHLTSGRGNWSAALVVPLRQLKSSSINASVTEGTKRTL
jgi:hypothetical protein